MGQFFPCFLNDITDVVTLQYAYSGFMVALSPPPPHNKIYIINTGRVECVFYIKMYYDDAIKEMFFLLCHSDDAQGQQNEKWCGTDKMTGIPSSFISKMNFKKTLWQFSIYFLISFKGLNRFSIEGLKVFFLRMMDL